VPVVHTLTTSLRRHFSVDITGDELHDFFGEFGLGIHMLQRSQDRDDGVAVSKIEFAPVYLLIFAEPFLILV